MRTHDAMRLAYRQALMSPDPSTQTGAVIINPMGSVIGLGFNGYPNGVHHSEERLQRPLKYQVIEHAERNAIYNAGVSGSSCAGATMVAVWAACPDCARAIIQAGITRLVTHSFYRDPVTAQTPGRRNWDSEIDIAFIMFEEAGVEVEFVDIPVMAEDDAPLRFNSEEVRF
jgi:dCMP deaminase